MTAPRVVLTDAMLRKLRYDPKKAEKAAATDHPRMIVRDATVPILEVRITPGGTKTFYAVFKPRAARIGKRGFPVAGNVKRLCLGEYHPDSGALDAARKKAANCLMALYENRDPHAEEKASAEVRYTNTFESCATRFVEQALKAKGKDGQPRVKSWKKAENALKHYVTPEWTGKPLQSIRRADGIALRDNLIEAGKVGTAREVWKHLHRMFEWAVESDLVDKNPLHSMRKRNQDNPIASNTEAGRALTDHELKAVWHAAGTLEYPFGPWFKLLILTGQRRADWAKAKRSWTKPESELERVKKSVRDAEDAHKRYVLDIPAEAYKGDRDHIVPLAAAAWDIIADLPKWEGNDYFMFSGRAGTKPISGFSKAKKQLDEAALAFLQKRDPKATLPPYRIHDFRVTCRTRLGDELEVPEAICEAVLGHAQGFLGKVYNKADYMPQRRAALDSYAAHVLKVVK